jgi:hypothetical protein
LITRVEGLEQFETVQAPSTTQAYAFVTLANGVILVTLLETGSHMEIIAEVSQSENSYVLGDVQKIILARFAGEMCFREEGELRQWNGKSGTYTPDCGPADFGRLVGHHYLEQALQANLPESAFVGLEPLSFND